MYKSLLTTSSILTDNSMEENDEICLGLGLGLGLHEYTPKRESLHKNNKRVFFLDLSIPNSHPNDHGISPSSSILKINIGEDEKQGTKEEDCTNFSKDCSRKKLRLTRDQSTLLEDSFKQHSTLNTARKQALAERLNLKPRQVEVWFQNRRARTKLKQTEVDCQFLKKNSEILSEENLKLKKELLELRSSMKTEKTTPFFYQISKACPSCEKIDESNINRGVSGETAAVMEVVRQPINNPNDHQKTASLG